MRYFRIKTQNENNLNNEKKRAKQYNEFEMCQQQLTISDRIKSLLIKNQFCFIRIRHTHTHQIGVYFLLGEFGSFFLLEHIFSGIDRKFCLEF